MTLRRPILAVAAVLLLAFQSRAEAFRSYTSADGLSYGTTLFSTQDGSGLMWFGTEDGLNSFDGYSFKVYRNDKSDPGTVPGDRISSMTVSSDGTLWVSAGRKIARYNRDEDRFQSWEHQSLRRQVRNIFEISEGKMGVAFEGQVWCFNVDSNLFETKSLPAEIVNSSVACCCSDGKKIAFGIASGDILIWERSSGRVSQLADFPSGRMLRCLVWGGQDLWVGTEGDGLYRTNPETGETVHFSTTSSGLNSDYIRALCFDADNRLWIGSYQGLDILKDGVFTHFSHNPSDHSSLGDNSVRTITKDNQGGMWIGSFYGGVNYWHKTLDRFSLVRKGSVHGLSEDPDGHIWMGVDYRTVASFDPSTGKVREYKVSGHQRSPLNIKAFHFDGDIVYLCSRLAGMVVLNRRDGSFFSTNCGGQANNISCVLPKDADNLYLGTPDGVLLYCKSTGTAKRLTSSMPKSVNCMLRDESGSIWVGGNGGVARFEESGGEFVQTMIDESISKLRKVRRIFQVSSGDFYFCADRLYRFEPQLARMEIFSVEDGLPTNLISDILEDDFGRIWLFTSNGICCHDPDSRNFKRLNVGSDMFISSLGSTSICRTGNGQVYVGTKDGVISFKPESIEDNPFSPAPSVVSVCNSDGRINGDIRLPWDRNTLSFEFATFNYLSGGSDEFAFKLEGYDKDWRHQKSDNKVTYYNIPSGRYRFLLKSANNDGLWCQETLERKVVIRPYFAVSPLAIALYVLLGLGIAVALVYIRFQKQERSHIEEVHALKVKFFINFLNELKTPLTLINSPLQEMIPRAESKWMRSQLRHVEKNTGRLLHLVSQMMLFRKAQLDVIELKVCRYDADRMIRDTVSNFAEYMKRKGVSCEYHSDLDGKQVLVDPQYLELILSNLLSNAAKFTDNGKVEISSKVVEGKLVIEVRDTGKGIPEGKLGRIFSSYESLGSGLGLSIVRQLLDKHHGSLKVESMEGKGSCFTAYIPQSPETYSSDETVSETDYVFDPGNVLSDFDNYESTEESEPLPPASVVKGRILLVISDEKIRQYLIEGLSRHFDVLTCEEETEAIALCLSKEVNALIAADDGLDPLRLCRKMKSETNLRHIPVVILSSTDDTGAQLNAFRAGASDFVPKPFSLAVLAVKLSNMMAQREMKSEPIQVSGNEDERFIDKVNAFVMSRLDDTNLSVNDLVREIGMSRSSFFLKMKDLTGLSPQDYLRNIRLSESCKLLLEGKKSVAEIADLTGFNTASYFTRAFKSYYGVLPSKYRSQHEKKN